MDKDDLRKQENKNLLDKLEKNNIIKKDKETGMRVGNSTINTTWGLSEKSIKGMQVANEIHSTKHGLYAAIPMVCKESDCPYAPVCPILKAGLTTLGERCVLEISLITKKYTEYMKELDIEEEDSVDLSLLKDLIDYDVQILRAENKMAVDGDFVKENVVGIGDDGAPIVQEQISNAANYKDKIQSKRNRTLELLNSTRKDKAGSKLTVTLDPSQYASKLMKEAESQLTIDAEYEEFKSLVEEAGGTVEDLDILEETEE